MSLQDITITSSINSYPTLSYGQKTYIASTDEQSFPIETVTGSQAGSWPIFVQDTNYTLGLVVNVTQSWSGSNVTSLGIVPYIHDTNEEFFNGEFSGSNYVVSDGNLNDAQRQQFLQINTTPVNYKIVPFFKNTIGLDQFPQLLDVFTTPKPGEALIGYYNFAGTQVKGVYAKIARLDADGHDNTLSLQELKQFNYIDSAAGEIVFNVINISEYPTYYFYEVTSNSTTSLPADDNISSYALSANSSVVQTVIDTGFSYLINNWSESTDDANGFNPLSGTYIFNSTPNFTITLNVSGDFTQNPSWPAFQDVQFGIADITDVLNGSNPNPIWVSAGGFILTGTQTLTHNASVTNFISGRKYAVVALSLYGGPLTVTNLQWNFTQTATPQTSQNFFILEPYLTGTFRNSDSDVLMNNYSENDYSRFYREVLYDNGGTTPSNFQQIISGTAQFAEVNDYLFNAHANTLPRYSGVRTTSANVNSPSTEKISNKELNLLDVNQLNISNGIPNVSNLQTYFAYFDYFQGTSGELLNKSAVHIIYLIDKDGNIQTPSLTSSYYWNLIDNFETDKKTNIIIENVNGEKITLGNKTILRPGALPRAILESQIGPNKKVINNISFGTNTNATSGENYDFSLTARFGVDNANPQLISPGGPTPTDEVLNLGLTTFENPNVILNTGNNSIKFLKGSSNYFVSLALTLAAVEEGGVSGTFGATASIQYSDDDGIGWTSFYEEGITFQDYGGDVQTIYTPDFLPIKDRSYRAVISHNLPSHSPVLAIKIFSTLPAFPGQYTQLQVIQQSGGPNAVLNYISNYNTTANANAPCSPNRAGTYTVLPISTPGTLSSTNVGIDLPNNAIEILNTSNKTRLNFTVNTLTQLIQRNPTIGSTYAYVDIILKQSKDGGATWTNYTVFPECLCGQKDTSSPLNTVQPNIKNNQVTINAQVEAIAGYMYQFVIANYNPFFDVQFNSNCYVQIVQTAVSSAPPSSFTSASVYWETGSSSKNILTSSYFYPYYTTTGDYIQNSISETYGPNLPFILNPYTDIIRFEGDETQTYTIINVSTGVNTSIPPTSSIYVKLDRDVIDGTDINSFLIRRYHPNPNYITIDMPLLSGSGFLLPQYVTNDLSQNFDNIIISLKERTLI